MKALLLLGVLSACAMDSQSPDPPLPPSEAARGDLAFLREEEKLARDVYLSLYDTWRLPSHGNIAESEQTHMNRVLEVLVAYALPDPVVSDAVGAFENQELAALYTDLVSMGRASTTAALHVGATIEDLDLRDLAAMKLRTADPLTLGMMDALECGSRNHLRAFYGQLSAAGASYVAQYISQAQLAEVVGSAKERCGG